MALICATYAQAMALGNESLKFLKNGNAVGEYSLSDAKTGTVQNLKSIEIELFNAWRNYTKIYVGYEFYNVLNKIYGKNWIQQKTISFKSLDGYRVEVKISEMLKSSKGKTGLIAYQEKGRSGFTLVKKGEQNIDPGPFYLVWSNFKVGDKATYGDTLKWPYQLVEIDLKN